MNEQRFKCTACGKCCFGWLPLTLNDAFANAKLFPLAMAWTPVRQGSRAYSLTAQLGSTVQLPHHKKIAVLAVPTSYIPPSFSCPALSPDNLCTIHNQKPLRCRAMPFLSYREENDQTDLLIPRNEWLCDTSEDAPAVYRNKQILDRKDFDNERKALEADATILRTYIDITLKQNALVMNLLIKAASNPVAGSFILNISPFLRLNREYDLVEFAKNQYPVLTEFKNRTAGNQALSEYNKYYEGAAEELRWFAERAR